MGSKRSKKPWLKILLLGVFLYLFFSFFRLVLGLQQINGEIREYRLQKEALLAERERLQEELRRLQDESYIEKLAREQLGLLKPGEVMIVPAVPEEAKPYLPPSSPREFKD